MSAYELDTIIRKWTKGDLTTEQAIGQILQLLEALASRVGKLERRVAGKRSLGQPPQGGVQE